VCVFFVLLCVVEFVVVFVGDVGGLVVDGGY